MFIAKLIFSKDPSWVIYYYKEFKRVYLELDLMRGALKSSLFFFLR